jgi:hypothetical protein
MRRIISGVWWLGLIAIVAGGASSTRFTMTWRNPEVKPVALESQKVVALVMSSNETTRRNAEDALAAQITAKGGQGVPAWTILPAADTRDEERARTAFTAAGAAAVVTMEVVSQNQGTGGSNVRVGMRWSNHGSFWPHYRHSWGVAWSGDPPARTNVYVETHVHSLDPDELIWAGRSRTTNVESTPALFEQVASEAALEAQRSGLLKSTAH